MPKSKRSTSRATQLRKRNARTRASALANLDAPVWDEVDADIRRMLLDRPVPPPSEGDLINGILYVGDNPDPSNADVRVVAVGYMDLLRTGGTPLFDRVAAMFPPEALTNTNTFIAACLHVSETLDQQHGTES